MKPLESKPIWIPSPNFGERRNKREPDLVVLHYTAMETAEAAIERLRAPEFEVSTHYLIDEFGTVHQLVKEEMRAWHAGAGSWRGESDVNSRSIGIELANPGYTPYPAIQMQAVEELLSSVLKRLGISPENVVGHSDIAIGRKSDPGPKFDWRRLAIAGLSVWTDSCDGLSPDEDLFIGRAKRFGYHSPHDSKSFGFEDLLRTFRMRFRPWATGPLEKLDMAAISDLAARYTRQL